MEIPVLPEPGREPMPVHDPADPPQARPALTIVPGGCASTPDRGTLRAVPSPDHP
jgi:hypothetical protein